MSRTATHVFGLVLVLLAARPAAPADPSLTARAEELLRKANDKREAEARFKLAGEAVELCERAAAQAPADPEPLILLASALALPDPQRPELCRPGTCERAVAMLEKARAVDRDGVNARRIAGDLGIVLSRLGR